MPIPGKTKWRKACAAPADAYVHQDICRASLKGVAGNPASDFDIANMGNYYWGYWRSALDWAITSAQDGNPLATTFLNDALITRWQNSFLPYAAGGRGRGGVAAEGSILSRSVLILREPTKAGQTRRSRAMQEC